MHSVKDCGSGTKQVTEFLPEVSKMQGEDAWKFAARVMLAQTESMGTILNGRLEVFRTIAAALAKHKKLQLVLSVGNQVDPQQIRPAPNNAIIVKRAPQLELLKQAAVCITHAGLNTVLESLAQAVPQVAIPVAFDQPGVAARIAEKQTGVVISLDKLTAEHLSTLLNEVVSNPTYRHNACKLQKAIAEANGISVASDLIEASLAVT
jgi:zeaxanthin glucosyltransferase